jgi:hypothetical protein
VLYGLAFTFLVVGVTACSSVESAADAPPSSGPRSDACHDGVLSPGESGIDCGGSCGKCPGEACKSSTDCGSGACESGACRAAVPPEPNATDGVKNGGETDVDCGGPKAPGCATGKSCGVDGDCIDQRCTPATKTCAEARNDDGAKNGTETDVDCGGKSGKQCIEGQHCVGDADCEVACNYLQKCIDVPSCKPHLGGDTCGSKPLHPGEFGDGAGVQESCCRSLPVAGYTDPRHAGKTVLLDKYEITAGRFRTFLETLAGQNNGVPDVKSWIAAHRPPLWDNSWSVFLPSGAEAADIVVPRQPSNPPEPAPWKRNAGTDFAFGSSLYIYVHGHNCGNLPDSYGYPTFWYPDALLTARGEVARAQGFDEKGASIPAKDVLDVKSMTCVPNAVLAAFCHWDGGQLATDEVLDFITNTPASLGSTAGCGSRCAPLDAIQATGDSGTDSGLLYRFPFYADDATHEGTSRIATPGRVYTDVVRLKPGDEPWMDVHGNVHEIALDVTGAAFAGKFILKYRGIGYGSARLAGNAGPPGKFTFPEYKAAYAGGRCMRFK